MKVIQILPELNTGGVERGTLELGKHLVENGHESIVISNGGRLTSQLEAEGSQHITLPVHKKRISSLTQVKVLRQLFDQIQPDILHLRSRLPAWLAWLAWRKMNPASRPRLVTTVHGFYSVNMYSKIMTNGEAVICVSESVKEYVVHKYPSVQAQKLRVIHRGVSAHDYTPNFKPTASWLSKWEAEHPQLHGRHVITLPGRITRWKGSLDFVKVISRIKATGVPVHGLIVGEPHKRKLEFMDELKAAIETEGLKNDITLVGHRSDLKEILAVSQAVVSCSTDPEAFGRVTLEALALGIPVCGYDHGGVHEQLAALLPEGQVPVRAVETMSQRLAAWAAAPPEIEKKNPFTLEAMLHKTSEVYTTLLNTKR